jgi:tRNA threonylcarbamoyladenosine biosynthesis protein TsaB
LLILGISTSDRVCSAALWRDGVVLARMSFDGAGVCLEELAPRVSSLMRDSGAGFADLDCIAADAGPGGMTGLKIGVVTARTLAQAFERPVAPVSALRAVAAAVSDTSGPCLASIVCSAAEIYFALFRVTPGALPERLAPDAMGVAADAARLAREQGVRIILTGGAAPRVIELLEKDGIEFDVTPESLWPPDAAHVCRIAAAQPHAHWSELQANYLCLTTAERNLAKKQDAVS